MERPEPARVDSQQAIQEEEQSKPGDSHTHEPSSFAALCADYTGSGRARPNFEDDDDDWDYDNFDHENIRRPPLRMNNSAPARLPTREEDAEAEEVKLQEDEDVRRKQLRGKMSSKEIEAQLEREFGERRGKVRSELENLRRKS
ncbi:hypothetical protein EKO04_008660 [Ascochyta lentis]|uniref:Uncharacterized protein n=1 Tax=Ascochyta lentis TaxID=205686 RepID=A0A8H7MC58_9PLEO|nr:hypothetical protein EKO04_008660 [Ascochyta lentis]